ncbi:hypothetical protein ON010_g12580 [Phytophthora cinnamomi]|nr:hypothetical protein ON010_g12580 [Phytophthora cinnamomi]
MAPAKAQDAPKRRRKAKPRVKKDSGALQPQCQAGDPHRPRGVRRPRAVRAVRQRVRREGLLRRVRHAAVRHHPPQLSGHGPRRVPVLGVRGEGGGGGGGGCREGQDGGVDGQHHRQVQEGGAPVHHHGDAGVVGPASGGAPGGGGRGDEGPAARQTRGQPLLAEPAGAGHGRGGPHPPEPLAALVRALPAEKEEEEEATQGLGRTCSRGGGGVAQAQEEGQEGQEDEIQQGGHPDRIEDKGGGRIWRQIC